MFSEQRAPQASIDIVIYYADGSGVLLKVSDGQNRPASYLFDLVLDELEVDVQLQSKIKDVFSLWLVSDLLELQLKPDHIPFKLVCYWEEFLEKYTIAEEFVRQRDEPILVFRRNVFAKISEENMIEDENLLGLLYAENLGNVLKGRYGGTRCYGKESNNKYQLDDFIGAQLAAIQAAILIKSDKTENKDAIGTIQYFKSNLKNFLPVSLCKRNLIFNRESNPEVNIANEFAKLCSPGNNTPNLSLIDLYKRYLNICQNFFFYESGFFVGQAEHPGKKVDDPVLIAVNHYGVSIIDLDDQVWLLSLPYDQLRWTYAVANDPTKHTDEIRHKYTRKDTKEFITLPCIFLHWKQPNENEFKLLQIFTKSAPLIDNLIEAFVTLRQNDGDRTDGGNVMFGDCALSKQFQKLAIFTNDAEGKLLSSSNDTKSKLKTNTLIV